ncbi:MAG: isoprenylcysteine carboxylmethyltransferase family protein [Acidobacteriota bacterium]|nr:isoprenylcysteine carboxylmethyltransferase family protein [Acidobacteriota bacterium]
MRDSLRQAVGVVLAIVLTTYGRPSLVPLVAGGLLVIDGVLIRLWASGHIRKNLKLATGGPYRWVRHPLYVGNLLLSLGFCIASGRWWAWPVMGLFWLIFYPNAIGEEDRKLERLFGDDWRRWRERTPALVPRLSPTCPASTGWKLSRSLRLNGEPAIAAVLLVCLALLYRRLLSG